MDEETNRKGRTAPLAWAAIAVAAIAVGYFGSLMIEDKRGAAANIVFALIWTLVAIVVGSLGWTVGQKWWSRRAPSDD